MMSYRPLLDCLGLTFLIFELASSKGTGNLQAAGDHTSRLASGDGLVFFGTSEVLLRSGMR